MLDLGLKIKAAGEAISDVHIARALVLSLPRTQSWELVKIQLFSKDTLTPDIVSTELQAQSNRTAHEKKSETALFAGKKQKFKSGGNGAGESSKKKGRSDRGPKTGTGDECRYCHAKGHWANKCPKREEDEKKSGSGSGSGSANLAVGNLQDLGTREVGRLYFAGESQSGGAELLLDCGATSHMFCDRSYFTDLTPISEHESISVGDNRDVPVAGRGTVSFRSQLPGGYRTIVLKDALYIPNLAANLVSLGTLQRNGAVFESIENGVKVTLGGDELFRASFVGISGTLYHISTVQIQSVSAYVAAVSPSLRTWHRRMAHLNLEAIRNMIRKDMVDGLSINGLHEYDHVCEGCVLGKSHRLPFPKASLTTYELMDLIAVDLTGPMSVPTWGGARYALVIVEVSTRLPVGRLLISKEGVNAELRDVIAMLERQSGKKLKRMRVDNGTEFLNKIVDDFCRRNGIVVETTVPYTPEQNGIAERAIAVLFEMVRCMLHSAAMDLRYWGEAFLYAVHIRSITYTAALDDKVPLHAWTGKKPNVSHLRIFGSVAYANIPKKVRGGKLEVTSIKCRLIGWWADETKGYRLEDAETGKLITARDVRFVENDAPGDLAVIETRGTAPTRAEIDALGPPKIEKAAGTANPIVPTPPEVESAAPPSATAPVPPPPANDDSNSLPDAENIEIQQVQQPKTSKWASLPTREHPRRERRPAAPPGEPSTDEDFLIATNQSTDRARAFITFANEPRTYKEAMRSSLSKEWEKAIDVEYKTLVKNDTFEWVKTVPEGRKAIGSRTVFRMKRDGNGNLIKLKARMVGKGYAQVPGKDFIQTFASVARFTTLRTLLAVVAHEGWELHQVDVVAAYLQGTLDEEIYMEVPEGVNVKGKEGFVWKLKKAIYGLKQAGRQWKATLDAAMREFGFVKSNADDCLYILIEDGKIALLVLVYVDDMAIAGPNGIRIEKFKTDLGDKFEITDLGELKYILGIQVSRDRKARTISLNQTAYINQILARFGMQDCTPVSTPLNVKHGLSASQSPKTAEELAQYLEYAKGINYLELTGSLLYATQTRPEMQFAVGVIAQFGGNPGIPHLEAAKRCLRYLKGTADFVLTFGAHKRRFG